MNCTRKCRSLLLVLAGLNSVAVCAGNVGPAGPGFSYIPSVSLQGGAFWANQGSSQHINIDGLIGDDFLVKSGSDFNGLVGVGLYWHGLDTKYAGFSYGVNAFYLPKTSVNGTVVQESLFDNLAYSYSVTNWPIYFGARTDVHNSFTDKVDITFDAGIGPNIIQAHNFKERSLDDGVTMPDHIFTNHTSTAFSAMGGVGLKLNNVLGSMPIECGYRFFYFGKGSFTRANDQVLNTLSTGYGYANAVLCSVTV